MRAAWKAIATEKARCDVSVMGILGCTLSQWLHRRLLQEIIERLAKLDLEERERSEAAISKATKVAGQSVVGECESRSPRRR